jgi:hypothetical protein
VGEDMEEKGTEPLHTLGRNENYLQSHYGKQYRDSSKNLKMELPYDPAIPLLDILKGNKVSMLKRQPDSHAYLQVFTQ